MLQQGDLVPHFRVTNIEGEPVAYSTIWQQRILVLVTLPVSDSDDSSTLYASELTAHMHSYVTDAACIITHETVTGIPCPAVVVADRWGEIMHVASGIQVAALPNPEEVLDWVEYVQRKCPECEGEAN